MAIVPGLIMSQSMWAADKSYMQAIQGQALPYLGCITGHQCGLEELSTIDGERNQ